jgi:hypothetical protein
MVLGDPTGDRPGHIIGRAELHPAAAGLVDVVAEGGGSIPTNPELNLAGTRFTFLPK